jgi:flagellar biosynthetic protein FliQ
MDISAAMNVMQQMLLTIAKIAGPILLVGMSVGLIIAIFQAATQIHEQTITFVPKLIAVGLMLFMGGSYMMESIMEFMQNIFKLMLQ